MEGVARACRAVAIMAKAPLPGLAKTRLASQIGEQAAAELQRCFLLDTLDVAAQVRAAEVWVVCPSTVHEEVLLSLIPTGVGIVVQEGIGLMAGLTSAFQVLLGRGLESALLLDADSPTLPAENLVKAFDLLNESDVVLGPCDDGGYYLIGAREPHLGLFSGVAYQSDTIYEQTLVRARELGLSVASLPYWYDVDTPSDLDRLRVELSKCPWLAGHTGCWLREHSTECMLVEEKR